jgi:uncharacterized membrane protein YsdA (DUF1294 family)
MLSSTAILAGAYLLANIASFIVYGLDKRAAKRRVRRIPESTLLSMALVAPFGAVLAMHAFHHKTRKVKFYLVYAFLALHMALFAYVIWDLGVA